MSKFTTLPSGRFVLRIDASLHGAIKEEARRLGLSLNEYCSRTLRLRSAAILEPGEWSPVVERAVRMLGDSLVGILAFGSWARGEAATDSDLDLAIVVEESATIDRQLYRRWDDEDVRGSGRIVESHFLHLPNLGPPATGIWAELAVDGIVLFEQGHRISRQLVRIRHDILAGRLVRRTAHGQPYWVANEVA